MAIQASVAVGLDVLHEQRTQAGSGLVLVFVALLDGERGRSYWRGEEQRRPYDGNGDAGRADALAGRAAGEVRRDRSCAEADEERRDGGREHGHGDVAGGR